MGAKEEAYEGTVGEAAMFDGHIDERRCVWTRIVEGTGPHGAFWCFRDSSVVVWRRAISNWPERLVFILIGDVKRILLAWHGGVALVEMIVAGGIVFFHL